MPFSRRPRASTAAADPDGLIERVPAGAPLNPVARSVVDVDSGWWWGVDMAVDNPEVRTIDDDAAETVWSARDLLTEIGDRRDLIDINTGLLTMALRAAASADVGVGPENREEPARAVVAVHPRFADDDDFLPTVKLAVRRSGLEPGQLLLSVAAPEVEELWPAVQRLRSHGVKVALEAGAESTEDTEELLHRLSFDLVRLPAEAALQPAAPRPEPPPETALEAPTGAPGSAEPATAADLGVEPTALLRQLLANSRQVWVEDVTEGATLDELRSVGCALASGPVFEGSTD